MISKIFSAAKFFPLIGKEYFNIVTEKLYGQGGHCEFNLLKRNYQIQFETIWQDHCLVQVEGTEGKNSLSILQQVNKAKIHDQWIQQNQKQKVLIRFKLPQDYTYSGIINGSISHIKNNVSNKLRCNPASLTLIGKNRVFQWGSLQTQAIKIQAKQSAIDIKSLTCQNGTFDCHSFASNKVLFSGQLNIVADHLVSIRSVVTYGKAIAKIKAKYTQIQSISGAFNIQCQKVKIDRIWASPGGISIKANKIQKITVETGTGSIESEEPLADKVTVGRDPKVKLNKVSQNKIIIE